MNKPLEIKLEDLFRWSGELEVTDNDGNVIETLYQKIIGDADLQQVRTTGLKESRKLREKLLDPESDESYANLPIKGEHTKEDLISVIIFSRHNKYQAQAQLRIAEKKIKDPPFEAEQEQQEQYIVDVEAAQKEYEGKLTEEMQRLGGRDRERLSEMSYDEILKTNREDTINFLCSVRMISVFDSMSAYLGTFEDPEFKQRRFPSYEDFNNLASPVRDQIIKGYTRLVMDTEDLKKSQGVMSSQES